MFSRTVVMCGYVGVGVGVAACDAEPQDFDNADVVARKAKKSKKSQKSKKPKNSKLVNDVRDQLSAHGVTPVPAAPAVSPELFELGQVLSFDKILSGNQDISCLTCHHPQVATDDDRHLPSGIYGVGLGAERTGGAIVPRNAPALFNLHAFDTMFLDSRVLKDGNTYITPAGAQLTPDMTAVFDDGFGIVAAQAMFPVTSREEMRGHPGDSDLSDIPDNDLTAMWDLLMDRLGAVPEYRDLFEAAYPGVLFDEMSFAHAANAIAGFEIAAFESIDSPWEHFVAGDDEALSKKELQGALEFFEAGCGNCHSGPGLSDFGHHNTALVQFGPGKGNGQGGTDDFGRFRETGDPADLYAFRTPPLFNIALTGPYGHDGQFADLRPMIEHYNAPEQAFYDYDIEDHVTEEELWSMVVDNASTLIPAISPLMATVDLSKKTKQKAKRIEEFLEAMTDESAEDLEWTVPDEVPSGLPVDRIED